MATKKARKAKVPYMLKRDDVWYFRIMTPKHLLGKYGGKREFNHALGLDFDAARVEAMKHEQFYKGCFAGGDFPIKREECTVDDVLKIAAKEGIKQFYTDEETNAATARVAVEMLSPSLIAHDRNKTVTDAEVMAFGGILPPMSMTQAFEKYKQIVADQVVGMSKREEQKKWNSYREAVERFEAFAKANLNTTDVRKLTKADAIKYKSHLIELVKIGTNRPDGEKVKGSLRSDSANSKIKWLRIILKDVFEVYYPNLDNPFFGVRIKSTGDEVKRASFTEADVLVIRETLENADCDDVIRAIAAIAENTGATPKEIALLEPEDIVLDSNIPHIIIRPNAHRRRGAKTKHRHREIPLIGRALDYARKYPSGFEKYRRENGSEAVGAIINKHIKKVVNKTFYSYRHRIATLLLNSGYDENQLFTQPSETMKNSIMGHEGGIQKHYGEGLQLHSLYTALRKALPEYA